MRLVFILYACQRYILARESIPIDIMLLGVKERVNVKVARNKRGKIIHIKPEYEELKKLAEKSGRPLKELASLVQREALDVLAGKDKTDTGKH